MGAVVHRAASVTAPAALPPIALIAPFVAPLRPAQLGGAQSVVADLGRALADAGEDVEIIASPRSRLPGVPLHRVDAGPFPSATLRFTAEGRGVRTPRNDVDPQEVAFDGAVARVRRRGGLYHSHAFDAAAFAVPARQGVVALHTLHLGPIDNAVIDAAVAASRSAAPARMVAVSASVADAWSAHLEIAAVVPNGADPDRTPAGRGRQRDRAVIAGRISPEKGTDIAIDAARRTGMRVLLVGDIYDDDYWREVVAPLVDGHTVRHLRARARRQLHRIIGASAVSICAPRWDEPFGMVALESAMTGTPVAALARGALRELVGPLSGRLAEGFDAAALALAVTAAAGLDRTLVRADAVQRYSIEAMVARYRAVYAGMPVLPPAPQETR